MHQLFFGFLILALLLAGCVGSASFTQYWNDFSKILVRNGGDNHNLLPPTMEQLNGLEIELAAFQAAVEKQSASSSQQAILKLSEAELDLVRMQQNILLGQEQTRLANLAFPNCQPESNLGKAIAFFENANTQAILANQNFSAFASDFLVESQQTGIDFESLKASLSNSKDSTNQSKQTLQNYCP
jgi:hypothetical protein